MTTSRLESFSDGCIAIFITIVLLTFKMPAGNTFSDLYALWPSFVCYLLSFIVIGIYWGNQHHLMHVVDNVTSRIMWSNLAWLFMLSLVSFSTGWAAQTMLSPHAVSFYGIILLGCNLTYINLEYAVVSQERREAAESGIECNLDDVLGNRQKEYAAMGLYISGAIFALWFPVVSMALYFLVNAMWFIPDRRISRKHSKVAGRNIN